MKKLATVDHRLRRVLLEVVRHFDLTIICGERSKEDQDRAFEEGRSKVKWPDSKHNVTTAEKAAGVKSQAVDLAPYPINWNDTERFVLLAGWVLGIASQLGVKLRWGGDWDMDTEVEDERFRDLGHFELV